MPLKMQYPVALHKDTKCPMCQNIINPLGGNVYVCAAGHVIEGILLVTMRPKSKQEPVKVQDPMVDPEEQAGSEEEALTPSYDKKVLVKQ